MINFTTKSNIENRHNYGHFSSCFKFAESLTLLFRVNLDILKERKSKKLINSMELKNYLNNDMMVNFMANKNASFFYQVDFLYDF